MNVVVEYAGLCTDTDCALAALTIHASVTYDVDNAVWRGVHAAKRQGNVIMPQSDQPKGV